MIFILKELPDLFGIFSVILFDASFVISYFRSPAILYAICFSFTLSDTLLSSFKQITSGNLKSNCIILSFKCSKSSKYLLIFMSSNGCNLLKSLQTFYDSCVFSVLNVELSFSSSFCNPSSTFKSVTVNLDTAFLAFFIRI